jgi:hypothetical protein
VKKSVKIILVASGIILSLGAAFLLLFALVLLPFRDRGTDYNDALEVQIVQGSVSALELGLPFDKLLLSDTGWLSGFSFEIAEGSGIVWSDVGDVTTDPELVLYSTSPEVASITRNDEGRHILSAVNAGTTNIVTEYGGAAASAEITVYGSEQVLGLTLTPLGEISADGGVYFKTELLFGDLSSEEIVWGAEWKMNGIKIDANGVVGISVAVETPGEYELTAEFLGHTASYTFTFA